MLLLGLVKMTLANAKVLYANCVKRGHLVGAAQLVKRYPELVPKPLKVKDNKGVV